MKKKQDGLEKRSRVVFTMFEVKQKNFIIMID